MNKMKVDSNQIIHNLSEQLRIMAVEHAVTLAARDAEITELRAENEQLRKEAIEQMDAEGSEI